MTINSEIPVLSRAMRGEEMLQAEEVTTMLRLHELGWGSKRLATEFGCARNSVRRSMRQGGAVAFRKPARKTAFDGLEDWLHARFFRHGGNADVIRQELASEHGIALLDAMLACAGPSGDPHGEAWALATVAYIVTNHGAMEHTGEVTAANMRSIPIKEGLGRRFAADREGVLSSNCRTLN